MKKTACLLLSLAVVVLTFGQNATIKGTIGGLKGIGDKIVISRIDKNKVLPVDTVTLDASGNFRCTLQLSNPTLYLINVLDNPDIPVSHIMATPKETINISMTYDSDVNYMVINSASGSKNVQLYKEFNALMYEFSKKAQALDTEFGQPGTSNERKEQLSSTFMELQVSNNIAIRQLISKNVNVLMSAFLVTYFDSDFETYADLYEAVQKGLEKQYPDNQFVQYVASKVQTNLGPGHMAPEIAMNNPEGKELKLSDLRGNIVLIDFWASWCSPCRAENPNVVRLYNKYHSKGFEVFSVSLDRSRNEWLNAINRDGLIWSNHVSDLNGWTSSGGATYGITSIPSTVLVDREGRIIARNLRGNDLERKLREIFGE